MIITLVFEKNANFFAENWQKSQKIVIITSTPGSRNKPMRILACRVILPRAKDFKINLVKRVDVCGVIL
jgi:hypothetical protein